MRQTPRANISQRDISAHKRIPKWDGSVFLITDYLWGKAPPAGVLSSQVGQWSTVFMMTSSNGNIFRVTGPLCGEFTGPGEFPSQRLVTGSFDVLFDLRLNKRLSKLSWGWWFGTPPWSLWRQCNGCILCCYPEQIVKQVFESFESPDSHVTSLSCFDRHGSDTNPNVLSVCSLKNSLEYTKWPNWVDSVVRCK